jgi:acetyl esterase/lipase
LKCYERRRPLGDETIPGFLGGKRPEDVVELYRRISPVYHVNNITTPLLLVVGEKDSRYTNAIAFYEALQQAGRPVTLVQYPGEGHEIMSDAVAEQHVRSNSSANMRSVQGANYDGERREFSGTCPDR